MEQQLYFAPVYLAEALTVGLFFESLFSAKRSALGRWITLFLCYCANQRFRIRCRHSAFSIHRLSCKYPKNILLYGFAVSSNVGNGISLHDFSKFFPG